MGRRRYSDRGKEVRRYRIAMWPEEWAELEKASHHNWRGPEVVPYIQRVLTDRLAVDRNRSSKQLLSGPIDLTSEPTGVTAR